MFAVIAIAAIWLCHIDFSLSESGTANDFFDTFDSEKERKKTVPRSFKAPGLVEISSPTYFRCLDLLSLLV